MSDPSGFQSELKQTYSEQPSETPTPSPNLPMVEQPNNQGASPFNNNFSEAQANNSSPSTYTKQTYPAATQQENPSQSTSLIQDSSQWTAERIQFTVTNCSFAVFLSCLSAAIMLYSAPSIRNSEIAVVFLGQAIGGIQIGIATSLILWHKLKSGDSMTNPLGVSNFFTLLVNVPIGIVIAACLYVLLTNDSVTVEEFLKAPLRILGLFYWVPFALLPAAIACWGAQTFVVNNYFSSLLPSFAGTQANVSDLPPNKFSVKRSNTAARCDICHREDMFDTKTSFCRRCQRYTV